MFWAYNVPMPKRRSRGEGTIYQRADGLWCGQITLPDNKRLTKYNKSQKIVRDWLTEQRQAVHTSTWSHPGNITVAEFVNRWVTDVAAHRVRPATLDAYQRRLTHHIIPFIGKIKLSALRPDQLQKMYSDLVSKEGYAPGTVLISHSVLHQALAQAVEWNLIGKNPAGLVHPPRSRSSNRNLIGLPDLQRVIDTGKNSWLGPLVALAVSTGLRRGELIGLHWTDVHLDDAYLEVKQAVVHIVHKATVLADPKSKSSIRRVTLPASTVQALRQWHEVGATSDLLFPNTHGGLLHPNTVNAVWGKTLADLGIPHVVFHSLRHLSATLLMEAGVSAKVVQERLGHSSIAITLGIYSHVTPSLERSAADVLDQAMHH